MISFKDVLRGERFTLAIMVLILVLPIVLGLIMGWFSDGSGLGYWCITVAAIAPVWYFGNKGYVKFTNKKPGQK